MPRFFVYVIAALVSIGVFAVRSIRASRREQKRIAEAMATLDEPHAPPPDVLLGLGLGAPIRWRDVGDGTMLALFASALVVVTGGAITTRAPLAELVRVAAVRGLNPIRRTVFGSVAMPEAEIAGATYELHVTWTSPGATEPQVLRWLLIDAPDWADAISAARRAPGA